MVNVTTDARELLEDLLEDAQEQAGLADEELGIRLAPATPPGSNDGGQVALGLTLDRAQAGDEVVEHNGKKVLLVDERMSDLLDGITVDAVDTPEGKQLTVSR